MTWESPLYTEINMDAEIGAYQDDFEERRSGESLSSFITPPAAHIDVATMALK